MVLKSRASCPISSAPVSAARRVRSPSVIARAVAASAVSEPVSQRACDGDREQQPAEAARQIVPGTVHILNRAQRLQVQRTALPAQRARNLDGVTAVRNLLNAPYHGVGRRLRSQAALKAAAARLLIEHSAVHAGQPEGLPGLPLQSAHRGSQGFRVVLPSARGRGQHIERHALLGLRGCDLPLQRAVKRGRDQPCARQAYRQREQQHDH